MVEKRKSCVGVWEAPGGDVVVENGWWWDGRR